MSTYSFFKPAAVLSLFGFSLFLVWAADFGLRDTFLSLLPDLDYPLQVFTNAADTAHKTIHSFHNTLFTYSHSFLAHSHAKFALDVLAFPTEEEASLVVIPWFILFLATWGSTISSVKYYTGITAREEAMEASRGRCAVTDSSVRWADCELARSRTIHAQKIAKGEKMRGHREALQRNAERVCEVIKTKQLACGEMKAQVATLSSEKQAVDAFSSATASRFRKLEKEVLRHEKAATSRETVLRTTISATVDKVAEASSAAANTDAAFVQDEMHGALQHMGMDELAGVRISVEAAHANLFPDSLSRKSCHKAERETHSGHADAADAVVEMVRSDVKLAKDAHSATVASLRKDRVVITDTITQAALDLADDEVEVRELHDKIDAVATNRAIVRVEAERAKAEHANNIHPVALCIFHARHHAVEHFTALAEHEAFLASGTTFAVQQTEDARESLEFSNAEHMLHLEYCTTKRERFHARYDAVQEHLSAVCSATATTDAVATAHRSSRAQSQVEQHDVKDGVESQIKLVSDDYSEARDKRRMADGAVKEAQWAYKDQQLKHAAAHDAYRAQLDVGNSFADDLLQRRDEKKARATALKAAVDQYPMATAVLDQEREATEKGLADACEELSARDIRLAHLQAEIQDVRPKLPSNGTREHEHLAFSDQLKEKARKQHELRRQIAEDHAAHCLRMAELEARLEAANKALAVQAPEPAAAPEDESLSLDDLLDKSMELLMDESMELLVDESMEMLVDESLGDLMDTSMPEFAESSSRDGTPEREEDCGQGASSYLATPALTYTSGRWSRSPTCSPVLSSPLLHEFTASVEPYIAAPDDDAASEEWDGAEAKLADG